jgi:hypothetical protein
MKTFLKKEANIPLESIQFFQNEILPFDLSPGCVELSKEKTISWAFVLMEKYQSKGFLGSYSFQLWSFQKEGQEIVVRCLNEQDVVVMEMLLEIGSHHQKNFMEFKAYVVGNKCMLLNEYRDKARQASA